MANKIVMLCGNDAFSLYMYNAIHKIMDIHTVFIEEPVNRKKFIQRRIKKLGILKVSGQILFRLICVPTLCFFSRKRIAEIKQVYGLSSEPVNHKNLLKLSSVNSTECLEQLKKINPDIVIVNGTRIISKKILNATQAKFINTHAGITPQYRGVHGAYWALREGDKEHCGVTVHLVDAGIDTGGILYQKNIDVLPEDNFCTYPYIQTGEGIALMLQAITDIKNDKMMVYKKEAGTKSKLWYHPTLWEYIYHRLINRIK